VICGEGWWRRCCCCCCCCCLAAAAATGLPACMPCSCCCWCGGRVRGRAAAFAWERGQTFGHGMQIPAEQLQELGQAEGCVQGGRRMLLLLLLLLVLHRKWALNGSDLRGSCMDRKGPCTPENCGGSDACRWGLWLWRVCSL